MNEEYAAKQLGKLWEYSEHITTDALKERDQTIQQLQKQIDALKGQFETSQNC